MYAPKYRSALAAILSTAAVVAGVNTAAPARAGATEPALVQTVSIPVGYDDLDLTTGEGVAALNRRVEAAARKACRPAPKAIRGVRLVKQINTCIEGALAGAYRDVEIAVVAARNETRQVQRETESSGGTPGR